jgi:hypothetical protein
MKEDYAMQIAIARYGEKIQSNKDAIEDRHRIVTERVVKLEANQRWAILTMLGLIMKAVFDTISKGGGLS